MTDKMPDDYNVFEDAEAAASDAETGGGALPTPPAPPDQREGFAGDTESITDKVAGYLEAYRPGSRMHTLIKALAILCDRLGLSLVGPQPDEDAHPFSRVFMIGDGEAVAHAMKILEEEMHRNHDDGRAL